MGNFEENIAAGDSVDAKAGASTTTVRKFSTSKVDDSVSMADLYKLLSKLVDKDISNNNSENTQKHGDEQKEFDETDFLDEEDEDDLVTSPSSDSIRALIEKRSTELCDDMMLKTKMDKSKRPNSLTTCTASVNPEI